MLTLSRPLKLHTSFPRTTNNTLDFNHELDLLSRFIFLIASLETNLLLTLISSLYFLQQTHLFSVFSLTSLVFFSFFALVSLILVFLSSLFILQIHPNRLREVFNTYRFESTVTDEFFENDENWSDDNQTPTKPLPHTVPFFPFDWGLLLLLGKGIILGISIWIALLLPSMFFSMFTVSFFLFVLHIPIHYGYPFAFMLTNYLLEIYLLKLLNIRYESSLNHVYSHRKGVLLLKRKDKINWDEGHIICPACGTVNNINAKRCILCHEPLSP